MSKEQIEEMGFIIQENSPLSKISSEDVAESLYNAGYCKQGEGEWVSNRQTDEYICSLCGMIAPVDCLKEYFYKSNFCPNCGAKMRKENDGK